MKNMKKDGILRSAKSTTHLGFEQQIWHRLKQTDFSQSSSGCHGSHEILKRRVAISPLPGVKRILKVDSLLTEVGSFYTQILRMCLWEVWVRD